MAIELRPVLFSSVPKCGKNLVYSFCIALGMRRWKWGAAPSVLHLAHFERFGGGRQNYAFPRTHIVGEDERRGAASDIVAQLAALPPGTIAHNHFLPEPELVASVAQTGTSAVFLCRDPRDSLLSMLNFARTKALPEHVATVLSKLDDAEALRLLIEGDDLLVPFADYFDAYHGWLEAPGVTVLRFEDLVGVRGGGDAERQQRACATLARLAGLGADDPRVAAARERVFNVRAGTFFRGQIGGWREAFSPAVQQSYARHAGWLASRWGYPDH